MEISVISRYHGNCYRENIKLPIKPLLLHMSITELSVLRNECLGGAVD